MQLNKKAKLSDAKMRELGELILGSNVLAMLDKKTLESIHKQAKAFVKEMKK